MKDYPPNIQTRIKHTAEALGKTFEEMAVMTDAELLKQPYFGRMCLDAFRSEWPGKFTSDQLARKLAPFTTDDLRKEIRRRGKEGF